jgi:protein TonB
VFDELVSSKVKRQVAPVRGLMVGMLHGLVIMGAIRVTGRPPEPPPVDRTPIDLVYQPPTVPAAATTVIADPGAPPAPVDAPVIPPTPVDMPTTIPPVTPGPPIDAATLRRILSSGTPGTASTGGDSTSIAGVRAATEVDDPAVVVHQPSPRYPRVLQEAGIEGRVLVEFIIDTTGHMEGESFRVLESSNPGFNAAAAETLRRSVFRPARVHGSPVRQRTVQSIAFRIVR